MSWRFVFLYVCFVSMTYRCYICGATELSVPKFRSHLRRHQDLAEIKLPILCLQGNCTSSFCKIYNFMRHLDSFHGLETDARLMESLTSNVNKSPTDATAEPDVSCEIGDDGSQCAASVDSCLDDVRQEGISLVASLRANSSIPYNAVPAIVNSCNHMATSLVHCAEVAVLEAVGEAVDSASVTDAVHEKLKRCHNPLEFLSSVYKQDTYFEKHNLYVKPESVCFGSRFESHAGKSKLVYDTFQYVSVTQTLKNLIKNKNYVEAVLFDKRKPGIYTNFCDGDSVSNHPLFGSVDKFSLMLQLFFDGLGTTNPLRGQSTINNVGVFFYTVKNLPAKHNSSFANVHLLALCYMEDLKVYGFNPILEKFVAEIVNLQQFGFEADLPLLGKCQVYSSLCQVTCDNLALNGILGFIESFSCDYFCTICYATQETIQINFRSEMFTKRTISDYVTDVKNCENRKQGKIHSRGVKRNCILNNIEGFHVTENWSLDVMHIVLEGIVPVELSCILYGLCSEKVLDIETLNRDISLFWGHLTVNKSDKPPAINKILEPGHGLSPSMKAVQCWSLLKYLPLAVGKAVPCDNVHWLFLLHLSHLVDLIFAPRFTRGMVMYLKDVIEEHLHRCVNLYTSTKLRPKHHFLVHLPEIVLKSGPLIGMSCLKYELKNSFFKRCAHTMCNFTNVCHTLAKRHQQQSLFSMLSGSHIRDAVNVQTHISVPAWTLTYSEILCETFGVEFTDNLFIANRVNVGAVLYIRGQCVVIDCDLDSGDLVFGQIVSFVCCEQRDWHIVVSVLQTKQFCSHYHAFEVCNRMPFEYRVVNFDSLVDYHPLHYCKMNKGSHFIRLPYHVFTV